MPASETTAGTSIQAASSPKGPLRNRPGPRLKGTVCAVKAEVAAALGGLQPGWSSTWPVIRSAPL